MKIAIITLGVYPIATGGVELHSYYHALELARRGDEVIVFTKKRQVKNSVSITPGISVEMLGSLLPVLGQFLFVIQTLAKLLAKRDRIDLVHVHYATYFSLPAYLFHLLTAKPFVVSCHGFDIHTLKRSRAWRLVQGAVFRSASRITSTSICIRNTLLSEYQLPTEKVSCIPNGVDPREIGEAERLSPNVVRNSIVQVANLRPVKDPMTMLRAFERVHGEIPQATMTLVGDGPLRKSLTEYIRARGLDDIVRMKGQLSHLETLTTVAASAVFVLSSIEEGGNPVALMEAMALSKSIVATSVGGVLDVVVDGVNGLLVPPRSPEALAESLVRVMSDDWLAKSLSARAKRDSSSFTWERTVALYRLLYDDLNRIL